MRIQFAPLEGVTDVFFRRAHLEVFGGVECYYTPFLSPGGKASLTAREKQDIDPVLNRGVPLVPQVLCRDGELFVTLSHRLADLGYTRIDLNAGCPMGTVTAKGRGSGLLQSLPDLARLLDHICARSALPVSVKTRIGFSDPAEWEALSALYRAYPLHQLTVHLRTRKEQYGGTVHSELLPALASFPFPVVINGDLFSPHSLPEGANAVMLGRGLVANPALARQMRGGRGLTVKELISFHDRLYTSYLRHWPEAAVSGRMHEVMAYISTVFENSAPYRKRILRSHAPEEYNDAVHRLFSECPLKENPYFTPPVSGARISSAT